MNAGSASLNDSSGSFNVPVRPPFDLPLTVGALRRLPTSALYPLVGDEFRFMAPLSSGHRLLSVRSPVASAGSHILRCSALDGAMSAAEVTEAQRLIEWTLGAQRDLAPLQELVASDPTLGPLMRRLAGMKPPRFPSLWDTFCQVVPFQLVSLSAAVATLNRFVMALGPRVEHEGRAYWGVPAPARVLATEASELRACGLSLAKAQTLRGLAERALAGELEAAAFDGLSDAEAIARLTRLPGIGPWSAQVALLRGLGRLSVFPAGDSGAARGLRELFSVSEQPGGDAAALLDRLGEWRGYLYFMLLGRRLLADGDAAQ